MHIRMGVNFLMVVESSFNYPRGFVHQILMMMLLLMMMDDDEEDNDDYIVVPFLRQCSPLYSVIFVTNIDHIINR